MITVGDLVGMPHLGIRVAAGESGLGRTPTWAHGCELEDPTGWLDGGEIIMTNGIAVPESANGQVAYLDRLADRNCAALAISENQFAPTLSVELLDRANVRELPVLMVAYDVSFMALGRAVAQANQEGDRDRLQDHVRIYDSISMFGAEATDTDGLFVRVGELTGYHLWLVSESGRRLAGSSSPIPDYLGAAVPHAPRQPPRVGDGFVVPLQLDQVVAGHLVAAPARDDAEADLIAMHHIAMLATLELANIHRAWEADRRNGAALLSELLHGGTTPELAMEQLSDGRSREGLMVAVVAVSDQAEDTRVSNRLYDREVAHLQLRLGGRLWFLVAEPDVGDLLDALLSADAVGISGVFAAATPFQRPQREALWALERSRAGGGQPAVFSSRLPSLRWLPAESAMLEGLIEEVLGPITAYDREHKSSLEETLRVYLELNRRPGDAAQAMHCHRHTLLYRLRRIEELTGRDLRRTSDVVDFWLAFEACTALISGGTVAPHELADAPTERAFSGQP